MRNSKHVITAMSNKNVSQKADVLSNMFMFGAANGFTKWIIYLHIARFNWSTKISLAQG